ncbi:thiosulfate sulfurtransferase RDL1 KNAG_0G02960 [Huiozyma naganishii CBS 8797]|uniref:Rhodanese domain-containing protein n=1 Tax=Huiozyma naganishii (strain ATCC MYA-139 / BCRC 22969 / CBS 8797 / KCTC 17520 / NBRC 10181 / NCYC 3082 / Yp74L-3) TaxID=1071383 RepID=J7RNY6_HUIN7|nr:hypothetical protein KNAG_0G02960 [Kazachstania naganishii CBS 8797]CCK71353.1 hypothetical protein KNAG_0G02960 [Kazachstania naganishii CBS 8797]
MAGQSGFWKSVSDAWNGVPVAGGDDGSRSGDDGGSGAPLPEVDFDAVCQSVRDGSAVIVDVREPAEYSVVSIPGSLNVPYTSHPDAMALQPHEFEQILGVTKPPTEGRRLVFMCASGMRANRAARVAKSAGYSDVAVYKGSMNDWVSRGGNKMKL